MKVAQTCLRLLDVAVHLLDQFLDLVVRALAAQALDEGDPQGLAVEVLFVIDQVGLDQDPPAGLEGRPDADVDRGRHAVGKGGVDAVTGDHEAVVGDEVRGREAQLAAALVAFDHRALDHERGAEAAPGAGHVAGGDLGPDPGRGDGLAVDFDQRHDPRLELLVGGEHRRVALGFRAEAEVLADRDTLGGQPLDQDVLDELLGA